MRIVWRDGSEAECSTIEFADDNTIVYDGYRFVDISELSRIEEDD